MSTIFISFEGGEGVGKSTQIRLLADRLVKAGYEVCCLREPGGTSVGEQIRSILLDCANTKLSPVAELMLYEAARAQLVAEVILPALSAGKVVLVDRYIDSTLAYQAYARGLDKNLVLAANEIGCAGLIPTRTILLDQDMEAGLQKAVGDGADRMEAEGRDFHRKVHDGFEQLASEYDARFVTVPCQEHKEDTHELIFAAVADLFDERAARPYEITEELLQKIKAEK
ncbi:MAG: dTMP kinase [Coriobacteriales bacterium]|jgi:dTMP kinase|nr:dTMP kinase [Coriobacteriales bacterium]